MKPDLDRIQTEPDRCLGTRARLVSLFYSHTKRDLQAPIKMSSLCGTSCRIYPLLHGSFLFRSAPDSFNRLSKSAGRLGNRGSRGVVTVAVVGGVEVVELLGCLDVGWIYSMHACGLGGSQMIPVEESIQHPLVVTRDSQS